MSEHIMRGAELRSLLKSSISFNGLDGADDESLHLSEEQTRWWRDAKLGLFIHWGVYAVIGKGEWAYFNEKIDEEEYRRIAREEFHPSRSADEITEEWMDAAEDAGMKYAVMVTRHHDGFAMWDSKSSWKDFTSARLGPKTDYVRAFTDSCRRRGLYTGLYYSPMDWRFPGYFDPQGCPESAAAMKEQAYGQLRELCTDYGKVDILWYDGGWLAHRGTDGDAAWFWEPIRMNRMVRALQPGVMVSPRSGYRGDFQCDEGDRPIRGKIVPIPWEKCMSLTSAWGYRPDDAVKTGSQLIRMLADAVCRNGNLLLNVGPDPEGRVPDGVRASFRELGDWVRRHGEAIYSTRAGLWEPVDGVFGSTQKGNTVWLFILDGAAFRETALPPIPKQILRAERMTGEPVAFTQSGDGVSIDLPADARRDDPVQVLRLELGE